MDRKVLHPNRDSPSDQEPFSRTVSAIHDIIENKLYKLRSGNLESYFREYFDVSRAQGKPMKQTVMIITFPVQVYRFYNCARLLRVRSVYLLSHDEYDGD